MSAVDVDREGRLGWFGYLDWGAVLASAFVGLGITLLLVAFGSAAGTEAADDGGDDTRISSVVRTWVRPDALSGVCVRTLLPPRETRPRPARRRRGPLSARRLRGWSRSKLAPVRQEEEDCAAPSALARGRRD